MIKITKGLFIKANPKPESASNSLQIGRYLCKILRERFKHVQLEEIDVYTHPIPLIDRSFLSAREKLANGTDISDLQPDEKRIVRNVHRYTDQFIDADFFIFAYPLWNFGVPPMLKAYIDTIKVARKTFRYTSEGPVGLLSGKTAVLIQSSGDIYSSGPLQPYEHGSRYLQSVLGFIGVERIETILMEGMDTEIEQREYKRNIAMKKVERLVESLHF